MFPKNRFLSRLFTWTLCVMLSLAPTLTSFSQEQVSERYSFRFPKTPPETDPEKAEIFFSYFPMEKPIDPSRYVLGVGDNLQLLIWGKVNLQLPLVIGSDGNLFVNKIGVINTNGRTLASVSKELGEMVSGFYVGVKSKLVLMFPRKIKVLISGQVHRPGQYELYMTSRVADLIKMAGDITPSGSRIRIRVSNGETLNTPPKSYDLRKFYGEGDMSQNPMLSSGDHVHVPFSTSMYSIEGCVKKPGWYEYDSPLAFLTLLDLAGGFCGEVSSQIPLRIHRLRPENIEGPVLSLEKPFFDDYGKLLNHSLKPGDRIYIPRVMDVQPQIYVYGAIPSGQARVNWRAGMRLKELVQDVGGVVSSAVLSESYIERQDKETGEKQKIFVDLNSILFSLTPSEKNLLMAPDDRLHIPAQEYMIYVTGAVFKPTVKPFNPKMTIYDYIGLAGGVHPRSDLDSVKVFDSEGKEVQNMMLKPGYTIYVPEKVVKFWQDYLTITSAVSSLLISFFTIYQLTK